jgi:hypothetical protein
VMTDNRSDMRTRVSESVKETSQSLPELASPRNDPFSYFKALVQGKVAAGAYDPSSLANNMIVMEILDAAKRSAREGRTIRL